MTVEKVLFTPKARTTGSWKNIFMKHSCCVSYSSLCWPRRRRQMQPGHKCKWPPPIPGVIGKVRSFTGSSLDVQTPSGVSTLMSNSPNNL